MLPLVFVETLDLHVEEGVGRNGDAALALDDLGEGDLVGALDGHELLLEVGVAGEELQTTELVEIPGPVAVAEGVADERGQRRVTIEQPSAGGYAVGLVLEFARI